MANQNRKNNQTPGYTSEDDMPQSNLNTPMGGTDDSDTPDMDSGSAGGAVGDTFPTSTVNTDEDDNEAGMTPKAGTPGDFTETDES